MALCEGCGKVIYSSDNDKPLCDECKLKISDNKTISEQNQNLNFDDDMQSDLDQPNNIISCPKCEMLVKRGSIPGWQILFSIILFPLGMLTLLAGRRPTECHKCHFRWIT